MAQSLVGAMLAIASAACAHGQSLRFAPQVNNEPLVLNQAYELLKAPFPVNITTLKVYISRIGLYREGTLVWTAQPGYWLLDAEDTATWRIALAAPAGTRYDEVRYTIGIDSATNAAGAKGGALDATLGMYWAWHSGYINVKIEGTSPAAHTRGNRFEYHLGGFGEGRDCAVELRAPATPGQDIAIAIRLEHFFQSMDGLEPSSMTPGADAQRLSAAFAQSFQPIPAK